MTMTVRHWQYVVSDWMNKMWGGEQAINLPERLRRFFEEAVEVGQAGDMPREMAHKIVDIVYDKPVGDMKTELGQTLFVLFSVAQAAGVDMEAALSDCHIHACTPARMAKVKANQAAKIAKGI